jgi:hypothetical protein
MGLTGESGASNDYFLVLFKILTAKVGWHFLGELLMSRV